MRKKILSMLLSLVLAVSAFPAMTFAAEQETEEDNTLSTVSETNEFVNENGLATDISNGAILHTWCWSFKTITENMQDIAAAGFSAIQCSPIMECREGGGGRLTLQNWYYHYQATDYTIGNYQLGTKEEFEEMCDTAHSYGIKVIVDTVVNHMTSSTNSIAEYLRNPDPEQFPNGFLREPRNTNWSENNRYDETQAELSSLRELYTQDEAVQQYIKAFLTECVEAGADGFRFDAAKLIELPDDEPYTDSNGVVHDFASDFWPTVLDNGATFQYGEVLQEGGNDATSSRLSAYQQYLNATTASLYGWALRDEIISQKNVSVDLVEDWRVNTPQTDHNGNVWKDHVSEPGDDDYVDEQRIVTWVESHDSYCNDASYQVLDDQEVILGWAIIAARDGGTPLFFSRPMNSSAANMWGDNILGAEGNNMYKDPQVVAVNFFRNEMGDAPEYLSNPDGNTSVLMIERGTKGCVLINTSEEDVVLDGVPVQSMADGIYPDQASSGTFTVEDGKIYGTVSAERVAVAYVRESEGVQFAPDLSFSMDGGEFTTDTIAVTLNVKGCDSAYYQINDGEKVPFTDGDIITLGENMAGDESVTVTITGITADGENYSKSAVFTKRIPKGTTIAYIDSASYPNWKNVNLYAYGPSENAGWPGLAMEYIGNGIYKYVMPYALESSTTNVIFNNGGNGSAGQYPTGAGLVLEPETQMILTADKQWVAFDKAFVNAYCNSLKESDSTLYTSSSWNTLTGIIADAEEQLTAEEIAPDDLMTIYQNLASASNELVLRASGESAEWLNMLIGLYGDFNETSYTEESWAVFEKALSAAETLAADLSDASDEMVEAAADALVNAVIALVPVTSEPDTSLLAFYINEAQKLLDAGENLTPVTREALENALETAETAMESDNQGTIDRASDALLSAINAVREKGDKGLLKRLVDLAKNYQEENYTYSSWNVFQKALSMSETVLEDENMGNEEVEYAVDTLNQAIKGLQIKANFAALEAAIRQAASILDNAESYVSSTLDGLQEQLDAARIVYSNTDASQDEVNAATQALAEANSKARLKADLSALTALIDEIQRMDLTLYTTSSVSVLQNALSRAAVLTVENTQEEIDAAVEELSAARSALQINSNGAASDGNVGADNTNKEPADDITAAAVDITDSNTSAASDGAVNPVKTVTAAGESKNVPRTGDGSAVLLYGILAAAAGLAVLSVRRKIIK